MGKNSTYHADIMPLVRVMHRLRDSETGCAWDLEQDFASIAPYTIEEAYEVADAIERGDIVGLKDELGDLLLQVAFHARIAEQAGHFTLQQVIDGIAEKMIRRHPHIFHADGDQPPLRAQWEAIKAQERARKSSDTSALADIARAIPALLRADKLQKRAARTGFDWPDLTGVKEKIAEEADEVARASTPEEREEEIGDLLFSVVNLARHLKVDPETALRRANDKFETRFRHMEQSAGAAFAALPLEAKETLWREAKQALTSPNRSQEDS